MTIPASPTDLQLQLEHASQPVEYVGRVGLGGAGKMHVRREFCYAQKTTICGQYIYVQFKPVAEAIDHVSQIDCMSCRQLAGLGPIVPRES